MTTMSSRRYVARLWSKAGSFVRPRRPVTGTACTLCQGYGIETANGGAQERPCIACYPGRNHSGTAALKPRVGDQRVPDKCSAGVESQTQRTGQPGGEDVKAVEHGCCPAAAGPRQPAGLAGSNPAGSSFHAQVLLVCGSTPECGKSMFAKLMTDGRIQIDLNPAGLVLPPLDECPDSILLFKRSPANTEGKR